ncbi:MAG: rhomboid family intramembrane serine protease [Spirochaetales bacterium]|nr:rhomboid family intramembrane serine protease [Spirochaetales bacterium]
MKIRYNSPVILTLTFLSAAVLIIDTLTGMQITLALFTAAPRGYFAPGHPLSYFRLFSHILGHAGWDHLLANFTIILLIGPILEEKYRPSRLLFMILVTAVVTGILNLLFFDTALLGASGIAFMMIILGSITNIRKGEVPLTFILIVVLYLAKEVLMIAAADNISQTAHIAGGICGSLFGFNHGTTTPDGLYADTPMRGLQP